MNELTGINYVNLALEKALTDDPRTFLIGEDIAQFGGAFGCTRGLLEKFGPQRVRNTPISEQAITGISIGAAVAGSHPIAEIMFMDFITLALDGLCNMAAKLHYVYNLPCPLVLRTAAGAGRAYGATHSQSLERLICGIPGLKVVAGSDGPTMAGLILSALADPNPVIVIEHKLLYKERYPTLPITPTPLRTRILKPGTDITIIAWSYMASEALKAAKLLQSEEIDAEVIDLLSLSPIDYAPILASASRTKRVLIVEEGPATCSLSGEIAFHIQSSTTLDHPIRRLTLPDIPIPSSRPMELQILPTASSIAQSALDLACAL